MSDSNQPPKRDKFAALAAAQQQHQQQLQHQNETTPSTVPSDLSVAGNTDVAINSVQVASSPKRDKFASMAAVSKQHHQQNQSAVVVSANISNETANDNNEDASLPELDYGKELVSIDFMELETTSDPSQQQPTTPPKIDKFASLSAAQSEATTKPLNEAPSTNTVVKRDKFASLAAANKPDLSLETNTNTATSTPTKRDKSASLTAKTNSSSPSTMAVPVVPKRDKFSSLAATAAGPKRDKFSSLAEASGGTTSSSVSDSHGGLAANKNDLLLAAKEREENLKKELLERCHQRDAVWNDLDRAEALTTKLLHLAESTAIKLAQKTVSSSNDDSNTDSMIDLRKIQVQYQQTLSQIHDLLKPHAEFVQAYKVPTRVNRMYLQRVELRLADYKRSVLKDFFKLQPEEEEEWATLKEQMKKDSSSVQESCFIGEVKEGSASSELQLSDVVPPTETAGKRKREE